MVYSTKHCPKKHTLLTCRPVAASLLRWLNKNTGSGGGWLLGQRALWTLPQWGEAFFFWMNEYSTRNTFKSFQWESEMEKRPKHHTIELWEIWGNILAAYIQRAGYKTMRQWPLILLMSQSERRLSQTCPEQDCNYMSSISKQPLPTT